MKQRRLQMLALCITVIGVAVSLVGEFGPLTRTHSGDRLVELGTGVAFIGVALTFIVSRKAA